MRAIYLVLLFVLVILIYARGELLEHFANNPRADAISKTPVGGKIPPACTPKGSILGFPNGDNTLRLYDSAECVMLRGKMMPDGQCLKSNGKGNYSYECRGLNPVPAANQCNTLYNIGNTGSQSTPAQTLNEEVCRPFFPPPTTITADVCKPFFPSLNADVCKPFFPSLNADVCKPFTPAPLAPTAEACKPVCPDPIPSQSLCNAQYPSPTISITGQYDTQIFNGRTYYKITGPATFSIKSAAPTFQFFAVGGGGGAGYNNGGGGGGVQTNAGINVYPSQAASMNIVPGAIYTVAIGAGGEGNSNNTNGNGRNTTITGSGVSITALGGSHGGSSGEWCPSSGGGSGGGGCPSSGIQGGSTVANPASNAGAGAGGNPLSYTAGGPGIVYNSVAYGAAAPNSSANTTGTANTGAGGSNGGSGGSGVVILSL